MYRRRGERSRSVVDVASWPDLRSPATRAEIVASFGFSAAHHEHRSYPGLHRPAAPPTLVSELTIDTEFRLFTGNSRFEPIADLTFGGPDAVSDPLNAVRGRALPHWFVAGYGVNRSLPLPITSGPPPDPVLDRIRPLFGAAQLIGTGFVDHLQDSRAFAQVLQEVLVAGGLLPKITHLEPAGRGGIRTATDLVSAHRFHMNVNGTSIKVPATWLSQGYQSLIAWVADVVGQVFLEAQGRVDPSAMEGLVLIDEIDLHLHPSWQVTLIPALKRVFPKIQFIATTHSPMILPALDQDEVWILDQDTEGSVSVKPAPRSPALLTGSELLASFFEIRKLYPNDLGERLRQYGNLATDPTRSDDEDEKLSRLRKGLEDAGLRLTWSQWRARRSSDQNCAVDGASCTR